MGIRTITVKTCDRCGAQIHGALSLKNPETGELSLTWQGHEGSLNLQCDAGGVCIVGAALLCLPCLRAFLAFTKGQRVGDERQRDGLAPSQAPSKSADLWDAIRELVVACGGSAADFQEDITNKISAIVDGGESTP